jgi:hypothetical protein
MRLEVNALLRHLASLCEAEHLEAAAVGQNRPRPTDEPMQPSETTDQLVAGAQQQMIGVGKDDFCARFLKVAVADRLDGPLGPDRHENRGLHDPMRRLKLAEPGDTIGTSYDETEVGHGLRY